MRLFRSDTCNILFMIHILRVHPRSTHSWDRGDGNLKRRQYTVLQFFQLLIWTSERKSVDTLKKSAWKLAQLPNLKVIQRAKFQKFTDVCMVGAITQMSVKFRDFVMHVICSLVFNKSLSNLAILHEKKVKKSWKGLFIRRPILCR